jgi:serine protease
MNRSITTAAVAAALVAAAPATALAARHRAREVVVEYAAGTSRVARAAAQRTSGVHAPRATAPQQRVVRLRPGQSLRAALAALRARADVEWAVPNYIARATQTAPPPATTPPPPTAPAPNDPGTAGVAGGWQALQWNFMPGNGVDAPGAWSNVLAAGAPGGRGVTIAVLDTGVAYSTRGRFRRSPDFATTHFVRGYDFVSHDAFPNDQNGHGTHVAGTIAESTNNGVALTGLAWGAKIMPVRVLDSRGEGDAATIARGIRFAARKGARVMNLSLEFSSSVTASQIPEIIDALSYARRKGVVIVGASGNEADSAVAYPAKASPVISVGATTEHGCLAEYSNDGPGLDIVAPGGGADARLPGETQCEPLGRPGRDIYQLTFTGSVRRFGLPPGYEGTSMAAPHVAAIAALVIASRVLGRKPTPAQVTARLEATARDLGPPGYDTRYGWGLVNAAAATAPGGPVAPPR